jgi:hypothetical protein
MVSTGASTRFLISAVMVYIFSQLAGGSTLRSPLGPEMRFAGCLLPFLIFGLIESWSSSLGAFRDVRREGSCFTAVLVVLPRLRFPIEAADS